MLARTITLNKGYLSTITIVKMFLSPAAWKSNIYEELFMPTNRSVMGSFNITHHSSTSNLPERCYLVLTYTHLISKTRLKLWKQLGLLVLFFVINESMATRAVLIGSFWQEYWGSTTSCWKGVLTDRQGCDVKAYFYLFSLFLSAHINLVISIMTTFILK